MRVSIFFRVFISIATALLPTACTQKVTIHSGVIASPANPAGSAQVLAGYQVYDAQGNPIPGAIPNRGALDLSGPNPGAGYFNGTAVSMPAPSQLVSGTNVLGVEGTVGGVGTFVQSLAPHSAAASPISLSMEVNRGVCSDGSSATRFTCESAGGNWTPAALPSLYRAIPDDTQDDESMSGASTSYAPRPAVDCGAAGSVVSRGADCATKNPQTAAWVGPSPWKLITRMGSAHEVWQDQRTGLLWSSIVGITNWCQASGATSSSQISWTQSYNSAPGVPILGNGAVTAASGGAQTATETIAVTFTSSTAFSITSHWLGTSTGICATGGTWSGTLTSATGSSATYSNPGVCSFTIMQGSSPFAAGDTLILFGPQTTPYNGLNDCKPGDSAGLQPSSPASYCAESSGLNPPSGESWSNGGYSASKGGMGAQAATVVLWRLPTVQDYLLAEVDGIREVMPDMGTGGSGRVNPDSSPGSTFPDWEWTATGSSGIRGSAMTYGGGMGTLEGYFYGAAWQSPPSPGLRVRCVGR